MDALWNGESSDSEEEIHAEEQQRRQPRNFRWRQIFELENFRERFRFSRDELTVLERRLSPYFASDTNRNFALTPREKLLCTLRFYASGGFYYSIGDANGTVVSLKQ